MSEHNEPDPRSVQPKHLPQWIVWRAEDLGRDKPVKVPYAPEIGQNPRKASSVDPDTWGTYATARNIQKRGSFDGIGFVFSPSDPFAGIDLDHCVDPDTSEIADWALEIVEEMDTYTELSPSGTGLHIICRGSLPPGRRGWGDGNVMGDSGRYFTITNKPVLGKNTINNRQDELVRLHRRIFPPEPGRPGKASGPNPHALPCLSDTELIRKAEAARNGDKFQRLYHYGDRSEYASGSEADYALIDMIAFWTGPDEERIFRLFMDSALGERDKVRDRPKYVRDSIKNALSDMRTFYDPENSPLNGDRVTGVTGDRGHIPVTETDGSHQPSTKAPPSPLGMRFIEARPFPVEVLPGAARLIVREGEAAMDCPSDLLGMPVLAALSSAIGSTRRVQLKEGWYEYPSLFLCVVASPGSMKSPAATLALEPLYDIQEEMVEDYEEKLEVYEGRMREYEVEKKTAAKENEAAPPPPKEPEPKQLIASDTTIEALVQIFLANKRGLLIDYDELSGWIRGMDQYKGGKGADRQYWLSIYGSKSITVNRSSRKGVIFVKNPFVTVFGGIQPALLGELGGVNQDGLMDRFLFAYAAHKAVRVKDDTVATDTKKTYAALIDSLHKLDFFPDGKPVTIPLSPDAWEAFKKRANSLSAETEEPGFPVKLEAIWSKLRGYIGRLALVLSCARHASALENHREVETVDVENAWKLVEYFKAHARRVHGVIEEADPLDVMAGHIKTIVENTKDHVWVGSASELVAALEETGTENVPRPSQITKVLGKIHERTPGLKVQEGRTKQGRFLKLFIDTKETLVTGETPLSPVTPVTLSPFNRKNLDPSPPGVGVTAEDIDAVTHDSEDEE